MTDEIDQLADRHFQPDPHGILADPGAARQADVLLAIGEQMAGTAAGQHVFWMLTNLLSRQFKLIRGVTFDVPGNAVLLPRVAAFGAAAMLKETGMNCVRRVAGKHVAIREFPAGEGPAIEISIGRPAEAPRAPVRLVVHADGWRLFLGHEFPLDELPSSDSTLGPYLAACFAAGEVFKRLRGLKEGKGRMIGQGNELYLSLWTGHSAASWGQLDPDPPVGRTDLPPFYFAGAGAVAQAAALAIGGLPAVSGHATVVDPENLDLSNDNRYALATLDDDGRGKAALLADFLCSRGFTVFPRQDPWQEYVTRRNRPANRSDLDELERQFRYRLVLSCVDDNSARHAIQNLWPEMIIGGSTYGLTAKAITYDMASNELCLKCFNPVAERNVRVAERLEEAQAMTPEARAKFFLDLGVDPAKAEEYLRDPGCGKLSEQDLNRFAADGPMMSVGFVSVAAGVLLAAQLLRFVHFGRDRLTEKGPILIANFYRPGLRWLRSLPEDGCDCVERRRTDWPARWAG
jgi:molybdopterin/thiamine biosynthesis adenylyltransferase